MQSHKSLWYVYDYDIFITIYTLIKKNLNLTVIEE